MHKKSVMILGEKVVMIEALFKDLIGPFFKGQGLEDLWLEHVSIDRTIPLPYRSTNMDYEETTFTFVLKKYRISGYPVSFDITISKGKGNGKSLVCYNMDTSSVFEVPFVLRREFARAVGPLLKPHALRLYTCERWTYDKWKQYKLGI